MKNVLIGIAAGFAIGYIVRKMEDDGKFKCVHDEVTELADKTKKKFIEAVDKGLDQVESIANRVEQASEKVKKDLG